MRTACIVIASVVAACPLASTADAEPDAESASTRSSTPVPESAVRAAVERLPLAFEVNRGQAPVGWDFLVRCRGYHAFVASQGVVFSFDGAGLAMSLEGAERVAATTSGLELTGKANYFLGNDSSKWLPDVPLVRGARYADVASATSWSVGGRGRALEFAFDLAPGASSPRLRFDGARAVRVAADGSLRVAMPTGEATFSAPIAWQDARGVGRVDVRAKFVVEKDGAVRIATSRRDPDLAVHVDPTVTYESYLGGSGDDYVGGVALDAAGSPYITGGTTSTNFPTTSGAFRTTKSTGYDGFVVKVNASGSSLVYATYLGGSGDDAFNGIYVDSSGDAYVGGRAPGSDYPTTAGAYRTSAPTGAGVLTEVNSSGAGLVFSTYTQNNVDAGPIACPAGGSYVLEGDGLSRYTSGGTNLVFHKQIVPTSYNGSGTQMSDLATDANANAFVVGTNGSTTFSATGGSYKQSFTGNSDAFLMKMTSSGIVVFTTFFGGNNNDSGLSVGINWQGEALFVGMTNATSGFPLTANAYRSTFTGSGNSDPFVARLNVSGTAIRYCSLLPYSSPTCIRVHPTSGFVVCGSISNASPSIVGGFQTSYGGSGDDLVVKFNPDMTFAWASYWGGSGSEYAFKRALGMAPDGSVAVGGMTDSTDLPTTAPSQASNAGSNDVITVVVPDSLPTTLVPPSITTSTLSDSTLGAAYSKQIVTTGGFGAIAWTIVAGALPPGITLSSTGLLSGTSTQTGTFTFTLHVQDTIDQFGERQLSVTINPAPTVSAPTLPNTTIGILYDRTFTAAGGTGALTFSVSQGAPPPDVVLDSAGRLRGTPSGFGDFSFTVAATDTIGMVGTTSVSVHVNPAPTMTTPNVPDWTELRPYAPIQFASSDGTAPLVWSISGTPPATFDAATGRIIGSTKVAGSYHFTVRSTDAVGAFVEHAYDVVLHPSPKIAPFTFPLGASGRPFAGGKLTATDGTPPLTWYVEGGQLPAGVTLDATTGVVAGTIQSPLDVTVTFACADVCGAVDRSVVFGRAGAVVDLSKKKDVETLAFDVGSTSLVRFVELTEGALLGVTLTGGVNGEHRPTIVVADDASVPIDVSQWTKSAGKTTTLKGWPAPSTGRYFLTIAPGAGFQGAMKLLVTVAPKTAWTYQAPVDPASAPVEYRFTAPPGTLVTVAAKPAKGSKAKPHIAALLAPDGSDLLPGGKLVEKGAPASFTSKVPLDGGEYRLHVGARDAVAGDVTWTVKLKLPKLFTFALPDLAAGH